MLISRVIHLIHFIHKEKKRSKKRERLLLLRFSPSRYPTKSYTIAKAHLAQKWIVSVVDI